MVRGPMFDVVELLYVLPVSPGKPGGMLQQLPSYADLRAIMQRHPRIVAGYEVLLCHFLRAVELFRRFDVQTCDTENHVGTGEPHYVFSVPCEDWSELATILTHVCESVPSR